MDTLTALQSLGLQLPSPAYIAGAILFGVVGMAAYWHGKKTQQRRQRWWKHSMSVLRRRPLY